MWYSERSSECSRPSEARRRAALGIPYRSLEKMEEAEEDGGVRDGERDAAEHLRERVAAQMDACPPDEGHERDVRQRLELEEDEHRGERPGDAERMRAYLPPASDDHRLERRAPRSPRDRLKLHRCMCQR